jgi:hypothetical protein
MKYGDSQCKEHNKNVSSHPVLGYTYMGDLVSVRSAVTILVAEDFFFCGVLKESDYYLNIRINLHHGCACALLFRSAKSKRYI